MTNDKPTPYKSKRDFKTPFFASRPGTVRSAWETENLPPPLRKPCRGRTLDQAACAVKGSRRKPRIERLCPRNYALLVAARAEKPPGNADFVLRLTACQQRTNRETFTDQGAVLTGNET
jgi:hypothetical protein